MGRKVKATGYGYTHQQPAETNAGPELPTEKIQQWKDTLDTINNNKVVKGKKDLFDYIRGNK